MLKQINIRNYLSFDCGPQGQTIELSMMASKVQVHPEQCFKFKDGTKLLKSAAIFGANASGKSNLIHAIQLMKQCVMDRIPPEARVQFNKNRKANKDLPSYFEIQFDIDEHWYSYGFEVILNSLSFTSEWLIELKGDDEKVIFERDIQNGTYYFNSKEKATKERLEIYADDIRNDGSILFLNTINQNKASLFQTRRSLNIYKQVYRLFRDQLEIIWPNTYYTSGYSFRNPDSMHDIEKYLHHFDTGISKIVQIPITASELEFRLPQIVYSELEERLIRNRELLNEKASPNFALTTIRGPENLFFIEQSKETDNFYQIGFVHDSVDGEVTLLLSEESDGTRRLLELLDILILNGEKIFIIDELDRCLHPDLVYRFLKIFLQNQKHQQLICTTHSTIIQDMDLIRRDEIWFVQKDSESGNSVLYSLDDFLERKDKVVEKAYRRGDYKAVPVFRGSPDFRL